MQPNKSTLQRKNIKSKEVSEILDEYDFLTTFPPVIIFISFVIYIIFTANQNSNTQIPLQIFIFATTVYASSQYLKFTSSKKENPKLGQVVKNKPNQTYALHIGYAVKELDPNGAKETLEKEGNIIAPLLLGDETTRRHLMIPATTGSGKTELFMFLMWQILSKMGSSFIFVEAKGDKIMKSRLKADCEMAGRPQDFLSLDFMDPKNSNKMLILEGMTYKDTVNILIDMMKEGMDKGGDTWQQGGEDLANELLYPLIVLRDSKLIPDLKYLKEINNLKDLHKYKRNSLSMPYLKDILTNSENLIEFALMLDRLYLYHPTNEELQKDPTLINYTGIIFSNSLKVMENDVSEINGLETIVIRDVAIIADDEQIHKGLKDTIISQSNNLSGWSELKSIGFIEANSKQGSQETFYKLKISMAFYNKVFIAFQRLYGEIFGHEVGEINFYDVMKNGKILHICMQGSEQTDIGKIAKIVTTSIKTACNIVMREMEALPVPIYIFMDEENLWFTKEVMLQIGALQSVLRGFGICFVHAYQTDLKEHEGAREGAMKILRNTNTVMLMKNSDKDLVDELAEYADEVVNYNEEIKESNSDSDNKKSKSTETNYREDKEKMFNVRKTMNFTPGQGIILTEGYVGYFIAGYVQDTTQVYKTSQIPIPTQRLMEKQIA